MLAIGRPELHGSRGGGGGGGGGHGTNEAHGWRGVSEAHVAGGGGGGVGATEAGGEAGAGGFGTRAGRPVDTVCPK